MSEWISVDDKMPEIANHVIVFSPLHGVCTGYFYDGKWTIDYAHIATTVTHWQPLPDPPE